MPEPLTTTILVGIGGAATKEIIGKSWDSGKKWLSSYFENHQAEVQETATANAESFLSDLAKRVEEVEKKSTHTKVFLEKAFKEPSFSALLKKAIIGSAQTVDGGEHQLLAKLVTEKLQAKQDTTLALASPMACDIITPATQNQLRILGLIASIIFIRPTFAAYGSISEVDLLCLLGIWVRARITPLLNVEIRDLDVGHLEALSCVKFTRLEAYNIDTILANWNTG